MGRELGDCHGISSPARQGNRVGVKEVTRGALRKKDSLVGDGIWRGNGIVRCCHKLFWAGRAVVARLAEKCEQREEKSLKQRHR